MHKLSPLGLLAISAAIAAVGLLLLSRSTGIAILAAATFYGLGKSFFWPTMLGVAAEQFPKGGALTLNTLGGLGMLAVGVLGAPFQGYIQDTKVDRDLKSANPIVYKQVVMPPKPSVYGEVNALDPNQGRGPARGREQAGHDDPGRGQAERPVVTTAIFPCVMLVCYLGLIGYFRLKGGYKPKIIISEKEEALLMTGGAAGPGRHVNREGPSKSHVHHPQARAGPVAPKPWQTGLAPVYIGMFLWVAFADQLGRRALPIGGLRWSMLGAMVAGPACYLLLFRVPATWGLRVGRPLDVVATSTFGARGASLVPGLLIGLGQVVFFAVCDRLRGRPDVPGDWSSAGWSTSDRSSRSRWVARRSPRPLFLMTALAWAYAGALVSLWFVRWIAALMQYLPDLPGADAGPCDGPDDRRPPVVPADRASTRSTGCDLRRSRRRLASLRPDLPVGLRLHGDGRCDGGRLGCRERRASRREGGGMGRRRAGADDPLDPGLADRRRPPGDGRRARGPRRPRTGRGSWR